MELAGAVAGAVPLQPMLPRGRAARNGPASRSPSSREPQATYKSDGSVLAPQTKSATRSPGAGT
ncbi:hypothetical protein GCM10009628_27730 [Paeniglutamicibacter kerguelensis]